MKQRDDNTVSVIRMALRYFGIPVTDSTVREELKSHPHYPSFRCICDALKVLKIDNYPLRYDPLELQELEAPYIVHFQNGGGQIAFVTGREKRKVTYKLSDTIEKNVDIDVFTKQCSGAVIVLNPDEKSGEEGFSRKKRDEIIEKLLLPFVVVALVLLTGFGITQTLSSGLHDNALQTLLLFFTKIAGITLSLLLVFHEFEIHTALSDKLCHINRSTNCNTVLNDKAAKVFGWFGWADAGMVYFPSTLIYLALFPDVASFSWISLLACAALPYPVFSVYYQAVVLRKWCPMCLGVQVLLISEFVILLPILSDLHPVLSSLVKLILVFMLTGALYISFILYLRRKNSDELYRNRYLAFKRNPKVFGTLIQSEKRNQIIINGKQMVFGKDGSGIVITAFLSLHCSHCARAFSKMKELILSGSEAAVHLVLVGADNKMLSALYSSLKAGRQDEALNLLSAWYEADPYSRTRLTEDLCIPEIDNAADELAEENSRLFKACNIAGTPTFLVNGYRLPSQYDIADLKNFTEYFVKKEEVKV
jgi:uncharacterized membrane protein